MDKSNLLEVLESDIGNIESQIKQLNDQMIRLHEQLGGIKKTYSLLVEEEKMAREIKKESVKVIQLKNGMANNSYEEILHPEELNIPKDALIEFEGIDQLQWNQEEFKFEGELTLAGDFVGKLSYWNSPEEKALGVSKIEREVHILINADPRTLWKNIDPPEEGPFYKSNTDFSFERLGEKTLLGASVRGKSHAQKGTFRDDDFEIHAWENGWVLQVVCDGAGSAEYSREGSRIAGESVLYKIKEFIEEEKLQHVEELLVKLNSEDKCEEKSAEETTASEEEATRGINLEKSPEQTIEEDSDTCASNEIFMKEQQKQLSTLLHEITVQSAHFALKEIEKLAADTQNNLKKFASTLLFVLSKEFDFGTAVVSFSIGDGAIGVITEKEGIMLMKPDGGEYSGQTRFVTMKELFTSSEIYKRTNYRLFKEKIEAIMVMSDGISDPKFGTDHNLERSEMWFQLWNEIRPVLQKEEINEKEVLEWMDFHEKGEYDDRTLTILY